MSSKTTKTTVKLVRNRILNALPPGERRALLRELEMLDLPRQASISRAGEPMTDVYFPETCMVSVVSTMSNGSCPYMHGEIQHVAARNRFVATTTGANTGLRAGAYDVVTLRAGVLVNDIDVSLFANNLFDARPVIGQGNGFAPGGALGFAQTTIRPRTIGVSLVKDF